MNILVVHDSSSFAFMFQKYIQGETTAIYFSSHEVTISQVKNPLFFVKKGIRSQVNQIKELSKKYDAFLCVGWPAAAICYLAGVNYGMVFFDVYIDPEYRIRKKVSSIKQYVLQDIYKATLERATFTVAALPHDAEILKKYRPDAKIIFQLTDTETFNPNVKKMDLKQGKFTFFSPQRIEPWKGQLIMWDAIRLTKSDFVVLQTDWGTGEYHDKAIATKPDKVKIIPKVKHEDMPNYLISADALLGQISETSIGQTEREAALCNVPVFCYAPYSFTENEPMYRESKEPQKIAEYIDKIVADKNFRDELKRIQYDWVRKAFDNNKTLKQWQEVLENAIREKRQQGVKLHHRVIVWTVAAIERLLKRDISSMSRNIN